uniref:Uncharacterized protein n=1 Tax=Spongospora subterranea TaxID=70186 RepID=A0A0H5QGJ3_9EUKA|eukprot:CRZ01153.1 hypothetical protein [Spongospora subterranea]
MAIAWMHLCPSVLRTIPHRRQPRRMFEDPSEASSISTGKQEAITNKRLRDDGTFSIPSPPRKNHVLHSMLESENFCMLSDGHYPHTISNLAELRWKLERRFRSSPSLLDQFIEQLTSFLDDDDQLRKALQPALTSLPNDRFQSLSSQESEMVIPASTDSLIRSLLGVPSLQQRLITLILEKLPEFCEDQDSSSLWTDVPRMILFQLRYLDVVCNEKQLCEKLLDLLRVCPVLLQREILIAIPDIVTDSSHPRLVEFLQELLRDDVSLTVHILDTLSNLNLSSDLMDDLRGTAVHALETSPIDDLPVIIRFVMHSCTKKDAETTISSLLRNLKFIGDPRTRSKTRCESLCLVIEQLRNGILYHKQLSSAFIKCLQTMIADDVSPIAVWSLFVVNELPHFSGKAVITLKHWLASDKQGAFTNSFEEILSAHPDVVSMLAKSSLGVAEEMLRSADVRDQDIAETIYTAVFTNTTLKPDTLNCIIAHIGSGKAEEVDRALLFLLSLCTHYHEQIRPSLAYIQSLLDYCHNLSNFQLRTLFQALAKCLGNDVSSSTLANSTEVLIYIKKNLHQPHFLFQRAGIIGALCYINACGRQFSLL